MTIRLLLLPLFLAVPALTQTLDAVQLARARKLWEDARTGACADRLDRDEAKRRWFYELGPDHEVFEGIEGPTVGDREMQSLLSGWMFKTSMKPILLTGPVAGGKSLHLNALAKFLNRREIPFVHLTDSTWFGKEGDDLIYARLKVDANMEWTQAFDVPSTKRLDGTRRVFRQQFFAAEALEFLENNRRLLDGRVVIVDLSIVEPEDVINITLPTSLDLLIQAARLVREDGTKIVVSVTSDFARDLEQRTGGGTPGSNFLDRFARLDIKDAVPSPRYDELRAMFPGQTVREIAALIHSDRWPIP
jgi:hypothetical protein